MVRTFPIQASRTSAGADALVKAALVLVLARGNARQAESLLQPMSESEPAQVMLKAATSSATTTQSGWAAELVQTAVTDFLVDLGPISRGSQLLRSALVIKQEPGEYGTTVPSMLAAATGASFVDEAAPIPLRAFTTTLLQIQPRKISAISAYTREMTERSSFEAVLRRTMGESVGLALDAALFGTAAAGIAPAGLRNGVSPLTPATGGGEAAMLKDLGALAGAVAPVGGDRIAFAASPDAAVKIRLKAGSQFPYPVFATAALPANTVMAVALPALAVAIDPEPQFHAAESATLHMDDAPAHIGDAGVVAAPTRSLFQSDSYALSVTLGVSWGLRATGAVAFVTAVTW